MSKPQTNPEKVDLTSRLRPQQPPLMDPEIKRRWIEELRRPGLRQCRGSFAAEYSRLEPAFCAMGVLKHLVLRKSFFSEGSTFLHIPEAGFTASGNSKIETIMKLNDRKRRSLPEIADWIEENL
jgi:hypothetical protein